MLTLSTKSGFVVGERRKKPPIYKKQEALTIELTGSMVHYAAAFAEYTGTLRGNSSGVKPMDIAT